MLKRHDDLLTARLEQCVCTQGWCEISPDELRHWYGKKITKPVWRDLKARLEDLVEENGLEDEKYSFSTYQYGGRILISETSCMQSLDELATSRSDSEA